MNARLSSEIASRISWSLDVGNSATKLHQRELEKDKKQNKSRLTSDAPDAPRIS